MEASIATVTNLDDERLIREGEVAVKHYYLSSDDARAQILPMARGLLAARRKHISNQAFGDWLGSSAYRDIGPNERAALIHLGEHEGPALVVMQHVTKLSPRAIWEAVEAFMEAFSPNVKTPPGDGGSPEQNKPNDLQSYSTAHSAEQFSQQDNDRALHRRRLRKDSPLYGRPRAEELNDVYENVSTRMTLSGLLHSGKRSGDEVWSLVLSAFDAGFLRRTRASIHVPSIAILFPEADRGFCHQYDLSDANTRKFVRDRLMPAAMANQAAILAAPSEAATIIRAQLARDEAVARRNVIEERASVAISALPSEQQGIVMYGQRLWPIVTHEYGAYDYDQLRAAVWVFRDVLTWTSEDRPVAARAKAARISTSWYQGYAKRACDPSDTSHKLKKVFQMVNVLARLFEDNPTAECVIPISPKVEGEW